jgi:hypothetical protein
MCRSRSVTERDIFYFRENPRPEIGTERFGRYQFNAPLQQILQEVGQRHEIVESFIAGLKFDKKVYVAVGSRLVADKRAEQSQTPHAV